MFATCDTTADTVLVIDGHNYDEIGSCGVTGKNERVVATVAAVAQGTAGSLPVLVRFYDSSHAGTLRLSVTCATVPPTASPTTRAPTLLGNTFAPTATPTFAPTATPTGTTPPTQPIHTHGRALFHSLLAPLPQTPSNHSSPTPPCSPFPLYDHDNVHIHIRLMHNGMILLIRTAPPLFPWRTFSLMLMFFRCPTRVSFVSRWPSGLVRVRYIRMQCFRT